MEVVRYVVIVMALVLVSYVIGKMLNPANAHQAPSGWTYPLSCCSNKDCQEINAARVTEGPTGYLINLKAEDHKMLIKDTAYFIPYGDGKIKDSPDGVYHLCMTRQSTAKGRVYGGDLLCFFAPPKGF